MSTSDQHTSLTATIKVDPDRDSYFDEETGLYKTKNGVPCLSLEEWLDPNKTMHSTRETEWRVRQRMKRHNRDHLASYSEIPVQLDSAPAEGRQSVGGFEVMDTVMTDSQPQETPTTPSQLTTSVSIGAETGKLKSERKSRMETEIADHGILGRLNHNTPRSQRRARLLSDNTITPKSIGVSSMNSARVNDTSSSPNDNNEVSQDFPVVRRRHLVKEIADDRGYLGSIPSSSTRSDRAARKLGKDVYAESSDTPEGDQ